MPEVGQIVGGRYRLKRRIGEGATAMIWEAEHTTLGRIVAVKFLHHIGPPQSEASQRFVREAKVVAALKHRNVVDIIDFGLTDGDHQPYMVMERLEGRTLAEHVHALGRLPIGEAARLVSLILRGLSAVHDAGMVHRDLKPENIFLVEDEDGPFPKVLDFGLSRRVGRGDMTQEGMLLGTPDYMSPEQAQGNRNLDARTDIYSMGVILYELVTGRMPFEGETLAQLLSNVVDGEPLPIRGVRPECPEVLAEIVERAMAKDKNARFANARDMRNAIAAADLGLAISPDSGLIALADRPAAPRGVFGAEAGTGPRRARSSPSSGKIAAVSPVRAPSKSSLDEGATEAEVRLPEAADSPVPRQVFAKPAKDGPPEPAQKSDPEATTLPAPVEPETLLRRESTGRSRDDSVSAFTTGRQAALAEKPSRGTGSTLFWVFLLVLLGVGGIGAWYVYGGGAETLGGGADPRSDGGMADAGALAIEGPPDGSTVDGNAEDAAAEDAGAPDDAGLADDAGLVDAGLADDAGLAEDAGLVDDAGNDAGEEPAPTGRTRRRRPRRHR